MDPPKDQYWVHCFSFFLLMSFLFIFTRQTFIVMYEDNTNIDVVSDDVNKVENVLNNEITNVDK